MQATSLNRRSRKGPQPVKFAKNEMKNGVDLAGTVFSDGVLERKVEPQLLRIWRFLCLVEVDEQGPILLHHLVPSGARRPGDVLRTQVGYRSDVLGHRPTWLAARQRHERQAADPRSAGAGDVHGGTTVHFAVLVHAAVRIV